jgi:hypothetical protein
LSRALLPEKQAFICSAPATLAGILLATPSLRWFGLKFGGVASESEASRESFPLCLYAAIVVLGQSEFLLFILYPSRMKMPAHKRSLFRLRPAAVSRIWSCALILAQVSLVAYLAAACFSPYARSFSTVPLLFAGLAIVSQAFLLFISPFLIRSQGKLAILGCCVGVAATLSQVISNW